MRYRLRHLFEYGFLRTMEALARVLPYRAGLALAWGIAGLAFVAGYRRIPRIHSRIRQVFGAERSEPWIRRTAWHAWRNTWFNVWESLRTPAITLDWVKRVTENPEEIQKLFAIMKDGKGAVLAVPHMGNWELAGVAAQLHGAQLMIIARRQTNPLTNDYINRVRDTAGIETFLREATSLAGIARGLKSGKILAILPDLRAKADFIPCRFLGRDDVRIPKGMALFAREANVPIIPAYVMRIGWARHRWGSFPPIWPDPSLDRAADFERMTRYVMDCFDQAIREHPQDFFWFNGRWVLGEEGREEVFSNQ